MEDTLHHCVQKVSIENLLNLMTNLKRKKNSTDGKISVQLPDPNETGDDK